MARDGAIGSAAYTPSRANRARKAKETVARVIPELLRSSPRARHAIHKTQVHADPQPSDKAGQPTSTSQPHIRLRNTDSLTAARQLTQLSRRSSFGDNAVKPVETSKPAPPKNVCILNMAASDRIGGGFLDGSCSQEEFLCMRTTLYPSLWTEFYPLPETGGILSPDILVFRESGPDAEELQKRDRFYIDVISAAMLRFPASAAARRSTKMDDGIERQACSCGVSYCDRDREVVLQKMRAVLTLARNNGSDKLVLGAWGCGSYSNPVREVAKLWRQVLLGPYKTGEAVQTGIKEVVFAITDRAALKEFERCFADVLTPDADAPFLPRVQDAPPECSSGSQSSSERLTELFVKIQETEVQLAQVTNARTKAKLRDSLASLNKELAMVGNANAEDESLIDDELEASFVMDGFAVSSDQEDNGYYHFDSDDIATSGSNSPASLYEFRVKPVDDGTSGSSSEQRALDVQNHVKVATSPPMTFQDESIERRTYEDTQGWFSGSINSLSAMLAKQRGAPTGSPVMHPSELGDEIGRLDLEQFMK